MNELQVSAAFSLVSLLISLSVIILLNIVVKNAIYKSLLKGNSVLGGFALICFLTVFLIPGFFLGIKKYSAEIKAEGAELEKVEVDPTEAQVDKYIELVQKYGISNNPQSWNKVRGFWFIANESPYVTTEKKTKLRNFLMSKGLRLVGNDKNVIDNYKGQ